MEDHRKSQNAAENKPENVDFEFGLLTPSSPSQDPYIQNSPADHFFLNGRLLPHFFPTSMVGRRISRTASEDSSRSNGTNSRSSSSSSPNSLSTPRTSSSSANSTVAAEHRRSSGITKLPTNGKPINMINGEGYMWKYCKRQRKATEMVTAQLYGSYSQRWQYITAVPGAAFKRGGRGGGVRVGNGRRVALRRRKMVGERRVSRLVKWWRRLMRAVVLACRECHAMAPARLPKGDALDLERKSNLIVCN